jgi:UDP-N-acetyl-D-mannosaminuronic acid dehydrogenase
MMTDEYRLVVLGLGYVGLTLAAVNARDGFSVWGVDVNTAVIEGLKNGEPHFHENGLPELLESVKNKLSFSTKIEPDEKKNSIYVIAVGTSLNPDTTADYTQIDSSTAMIGQVLKKGDIVILRSTVIVGTTRNRVVPELEDISGLVAGVDFEVGFAPERTIEGKAIEELKTLPQVIASTTLKGLQRIDEFFSHVSDHIISVDTLETAEMVKLISNAYRDISFAFANSVALAAAEHNVDVGQLIAAANEGYERNRIPLPSPGVGGYCLTKDPYLFAYSSPNTKGIHDIIHAGREINNRMPQHVVDIVKNYVKGQSFKGKPHLVIVGLAFKGEPATSDIRYSPSIDVVKLMKEEDEYQISAYDPHVHDLVYDEHRITKVGSLEEAVKVGDVIVIMHGNKAYSDSGIIDLLKERSGTQLVVDTWGVLKGALQNKPDGVEYANLSYRTF